VTLFLLVGVPLLALFVVLLPWPSEQVPRRPWLAMVFLRGMFFAAPAWLALALLRSVIGEPLTGFPLWLALLGTDQLAPVALAIGAFIIAQRRLSFHPAEEGTFLVTLCFLAGFFSVLDLADFLREWQAWDAHTLFLLPLMRVATILLASLFSPRFYRWQGKLGLLYLALCSAATLPLSLASFVYAVNYATVAWALVAALVAVSAVAFVLRFPRAVRG
jgi:hypothetical protein